MMRTVEQSVVIVFGTRLAVGFEGKESGDL